MQISAEIYTKFTSRNKGPLFGCSKYFFTEMYANKWDVKYVSNIISTQWIILVSLEGKPLVGLYT